MSPEKDPEKEADGTDLKASSGESNGKAEEIGVEKMPVPAPSPLPDGRMRLAPLSPTNSDSDASKKTENEKTMPDTMEMEEAGKKQQETSSKPRILHWGYICAVCGVEPIEGIRYKHRSLVNIASRDCARSLCQEHFKSQIEEFDENPDDYEIIKEEEEAAILNPGYTAYLRKEWRDRKLTQENVDATLYLMLQRVKETGYLRGISRHFFGYLAMFSVALQFYFVTHMFANRPSRDPSQHLNLSAITVIVLELFVVYAHCAVIVWTGIQQMILCCSGLKIDDGNTLVILQSMQVILTLM